MTWSFGKWVGAGLLLVLAGGAASPEAAFKEFQAAVKARDADKAWNLLTKKSRGELDKAVRQIKQALKQLATMPEVEKLAKEKIAQQLGMTVDELDKINGKKLLSVAWKQTEKMPGGRKELKELTEATLENVKVQGDRAKGTMKTGAGTDPVEFVREGGSWKVTMPGKKGKAGKSVP